MCPVMTNFDTIQNLWNEQKNTEKIISSKEIMQKAEKSTLAVRKGHVWSIGVLSVTFSILIGYFIWIGIYEFSLFTFGLGLMGGLLLIRIGIEVFNSKKFKKIKPDNSLKEYSDEMIRFYKQRKIIHYIITPIIYISYFVGFGLLLPELKVHLSKGFYLYILVSGVVVFIGLGIFISKQIRKELKLISFLKQLQKSI